MQYNIFSKNVKINCDNSNIQQALLYELSGYPESNIDPDVNVVFVEEINVERDMFISPSHHSTFEGGFVARFGGVTVLFQIKKCLYIEIMLHDPKWRSKLISYDFTTVAESIGTIIHELVFVPMTYFFDDLALVHASAFKEINSGETYMIGGTGGVGKTSLELLFCRKSNYSFIADDIAVVNAAGDIFPNLSFPKIYGYNTAGDKLLEEMLLSKDSKFGKLQWHLRKKILGGNKVRRRISPFLVYNNVECKAVQISNYVNLVKSSHESEISKISLHKNDAVQSTLHVIKNEYHTFHQHITWHEYNCTIHGIEPVITLNGSFADMRNVITDAFARANLSTLKLPAGIRHSEFMSSVEEYIS